MLQEMICIPEQMFACGDTAPAAEYIGLRAVFDFWNKKMRQTRPATQIYQALIFDY